MAFSKESRQSTDRLAAAILRGDHRRLSVTDVDMSRSRWGAIPDDLECEDGVRQVILAGQLLSEYSKLLASLGRERDLDELSASDIDADLWRFTCELTAQPSKYRSDNDRKKKVTDFLRGLKRPLQIFQTLVALDHLKPAGSGLMIDGVHIYKMTKEGVEEWFGSEEPHWEQWVEDFADRTVASVEVEAASATRAKEKALEKVTQALHLARLATVTSGGAADEVMLYAVGEARVERSVSSGLVSASLSSTFEPWEWEMDWARVQAIQKEVERIEAIPAASRKLIERLSRAVHWIGTAVTMEQLDDKIVDLCTSLEAILTSRGEVRKGEAISVRSMLVPIALGQGAPNGNVLYDLYDLRSNVVHGSDVRVATSSDYRGLLWFACVVATHFADLVAARNLTTFDQFLDEIQRTRHVQTAQDVLRVAGGKHTNRLVQYADSLISGD